MVKTWPLFMKPMIRNRVLKIPPMDLTLRHVKMQLSTPTPYCFKIYFDSVHPWLLQSIYCSEFFWPQVWCIPHTPLLYRLHVHSIYPSSFNVIKKGEENKPLRKIQYMHWQKHLDLLTRCKYWGYLWWRFSASAYSASRLMWRKMMASGG